MITSIKGFRYRDMSDVDVLLTTVDMEFHTGVTFVLCRNKTDTRDMVSLFSTVNEPPHTKPVSEWPDVHIGTIRSHQCSYNATMSMFYRKDEDKLNMVFCNEDLEDKEIDYALDFLNNHQKGIISSILTATKTLGQDAALTQFGINKDREFVFTDTNGLEHTIKELSGGVKKLISIFVQLAMTADTKHMCVLVNPFSDGSKFHPKAIPWLISALDHFGTMHKLQVVIIEDYEQAFVSSVLAPEFGRGMSTLFNKIYIIDEKAKFHCLNCGYIYKDIPNWTNTSDIHTWDDVFNQYTDKKRCQKMDELIYETKRNFKKSTSVDQFLYKLTKN